MASAKVYRRQRPAGRLSETWYFRVRVKGRQKRISTGHSDRRKAEAFARDYVEELRSKKSARQVVAHFAEALSETQPVPLAEAWDLFASLPTRRKLAVLFGNSSGTILELGTVSRRAGRCARSHAAIWSRLSAYAERTGP